MTLKITGLELDQFQKFTRPVCLVGLGDGLNRLCEPNEFGKSTILTALQAAFFDKHRSRAQGVQAYQTVGSRTSPTVLARFEIDGQPYAIFKKFLGNGASARLRRPDGSLADGDAAEEELQQLLGFSEPTRGTASDDSLAMWGLLWVRQGQSFGMPTLVESARSAIQTALETEVGIMTGGNRGQALPEIVKRALGELLTGHGRPRGEYERVVDAIARIDGDLPALLAKQTQLAHDIERLGQLQKKLGTREEEDRASKDAEQVVAATQKLEGLIALHGKIEAAKAARSVAANRLAGIEAELKRRQDRAVQISKLERDLVEARTARQQAETREQEHSQTVADLRKTADESEARLSAQGNRIRDFRRLLSAAQLAETIKAGEDNLTKADAANERLQRFVREAGAIAVTAELLKQLRAAKNRHDTAVAAFNAAATEIVLDLEHGAMARVTIDGAPVAAARLSRRAVADTEIKIKDVGSVSVRPGVQDKATLQADLRRTEGKLAELLAAARLSSIEEAETLVERRRQLDNDIKLAQQQIALHAPGGAGLDPGPDALRLDLERRRAELDAVLASYSLEATPPSQEILAQIAEAEAAERTLDKEWRQARAAVVEHEASVVAARKTVAERQKGETEANAKIGQLKAAAEAEEAAKPTAPLEAEAAACREQDGEAGATLAALQAQDTGETVDTIRARIERLSGNAKRRQDEIVSLRGDIGQLRARIEAQEGDGIDERVERAKGERERLERAKQNFEREISVLKLLHGTLVATEREARERYMAPIVTRIRPYLSALFPGSTIEIDNAFNIKGIVRNGTQAEDFERLSHGTREQIAVLTRLAFAEMLIDQGKPAAVILDDALVFSDDDRMERLFDILGAAAKKMQIVVLTCRDRLFDDLGGHQLKLEPMAIVPSL